MEKIVSNVPVSYERCGGWHLFMSDELPGLVVAHPNLRIAFDSIPEAIRLLCDEKIRDTVKVNLSVSYSEFCDSISKASAEWCLDLTDEAIETFLDERERRLHYALIPSPEIIAAEQGRRGIAY